MVIRVEGGVCVTCVLDVELQYGFQAGRKIIFDRLEETLRSNGVKIIRGGQIGMEGNNVKYLYS